MPRVTRCCSLLLLLIVHAAAAGHASAALTASHLADYDAELRLPGGRIDTDNLVQRLQGLGVTTYYWLVWHAPTDWEDLKLFLPKAAERQIEVWVYLVPPSEGPPSGYRASEPFKLDYLRWAEEIARLSLQHTNLTGWVIDDFYANHKLFTPAYVKQMQGRAQGINPRLLFLPLMYFPEITSSFVSGYREVIDGVVVAYPQDRDEILEARAALNGEPTSESSQLACPWSTPTQAGDFVSASIPARVVSAQRVRLQFSEREDFTGPTAGYHFKQALVDGVVVWEEDAAGGIGGWRDLQVDLTAQVRAKTNMIVTFRLLDKKGVSNFGVRWRMKNLVTEGLEMAATFATPQTWKVDRRGPFETGFGGGRGMNEPRFHIPFIVMTAGSPEEFKQRHGDPASPQRIADWLRMSLESWQAGHCDGVVTYCLDKRPESQVFPLAQRLFREYRMSRK